MTKIKWNHAAALAFFAASQVAHAGAPSVGSREYKVLLMPSAFDSSPVDTANRFLTDLQASLAANGFDSTVKKSFKADHDRTVLYYDSPGTCVVRQTGYSMRERDESGDRKIELKFGSPNESTSANTDVTGSSSKASSKLEDDITPPSNETFSHSTSEPLSDSKNINHLSDINDLFPTTHAFDSISSQPLVPVSGLSIHELTFDGPTSDIGQEDADFTMTVWYANGSTTPALAEISFEVDVSDKGVFTDKVTARSQLIFNTIQGMTNWVQSPSSTKTAWVYKYQPSFCSQ
ncbi:hypothetical protein GXB81_10625 [Paraburkholderia sp. Ac-20336]|uniref:hypothetical protein n=1 Tax=Paraburkholderia sp. Ac-20336 TaxID=2703886 RepID=UPI001981DF7B|nr:hypothetical protein [Paraburkholderia sp. Ac-20336]MBN3803508.1 hypothetical protein [Paraburkholderia sp. Ac-20336]